MVVCDFARLEVTLCHRPDLSNLATVEEQTAYIAQYFQQTNYNATTDYLVLKFNNEQLHCELDIVDSLEEGSDSFKFSVWNVPESVMFKYYWTDDNTRFSIYHGQIQDITVDRSNADWKTTVSGEIIHSDLMYNWSGYQVFKKVRYYSDVATMISTELGFNLVTYIEEFYDNIPLKETIITYKKTIGEVLNNVCSQLSTANVKCHWKIINTDLFIFKVSDLDSGMLNDAYAIDTLVINYNDLLEFKEVNYNQIQFKVFGLPTVKAGIIIELNTEYAPDYVTWQTDFLIVDEVEHVINIDDGYISTVYAHILGTVVEEDDSEDIDYDESEY